MNSLRIRLLIALMVSIFLFWAVWLGVQVFQLTRQQTGWWDSMLQNIGAQILLSTPANVEELSVERPFTLPPSVDFKREKACFQVWGRQGRALMRSPNAPEQALMPDFSNGFADTTINGERYRVYSVSDASGAVQVQVAKPHWALQEDLNRWVRLSLVSAVLLFVLLASLIWQVICRTWRPVNKLQEEISERNVNNLQPLSTEPLPREAKPLVESFNNLLSALDGSLKNERRFIADAAHELRTPMAALLAHAQLAQRAEREDERQHALAQLVAGVQRNARLAEQLLDLARLDACRRLDQLQPVRLHEAAQIVVRDFEVMAHERQQQLTLETEPCSVVGDLDMVGTLLRNLIDNALRYSGAGGRIVVSCRAVLRGPVRQVCLRVADDGPGVPLDERERIFDRFYRAQGTASNGARGSGIGLSLVASIAKVHGATIEVGAGLDGRGFAVAVWFGAGDAAMAAREAGQTAGQRIALTPALSR
ncbi:MAG TPA: ATP-binding protein [Burkholderiaceae bacterium]|nr:ATP-binding protein [Burkholderiaceae bacterium]